MDSRLGVHNLLSSHPSDRFSWTRRAAGTLQPLVPMATPRTVWRIRLPDGSVVHCMLWVRRPKTAVVWYRDDEVQGWRSSWSPMRRRTGPEAPRLSQEPTDEGFRTPRGSTGAGRRLQQAPDAAYRHRPLLPGPPPLRPVRLQPLRHGLLSGCAHRRPLPLLRGRGLSRGGCGRCTRLPPLRPVRLHPSPPSYTPRRAWLLGLRRGHGLRFDRGLACGLRRGCLAAAHDAGRTLQSLDVALKQGNLGLPGLDGVGDLAQYFASFARRWAHSQLTNCRKRVPDDVPWRPRRC